MVSSKRLAICYMPRHRGCLALLAASLSALLLSACGGGGGSSAGGGGSGTASAASQYTIGGSVSGLDAAGLVLLNNGGDALDVAANATSFVFSDPLANGATYAVTIQSQPSGQTCAVANAGGSIDGTDVSSVSVTCQASTYSVGGSISGLTQSGLVLLDDGGDALDVAANATSFAFSTQLASGSSYDVTVQTQPSGETCTITGGSGTVSANVTNISITCATGSAGSYSIGGSVTGLSQSGLVLLDNSGDALEVAANVTSFTFSTLLASGDSYDITVQTQPSGETCTVGAGQGTVTANVTGVSVSCTSNYASSNATNVAPISVNAGPADSDDQTFNIPLVTVTVCNPNAPSTCATIQNVLLDTGSYGLRLLSQVLPTGFTLPPLTDPNNSTNDIFECALFADGYAWGGVADAIVTVAGETTTNPAAIPVQIIDSSQETSDVPTDCTDLTTDKDMDSVDDFDANGILGVGLFDQDCGQGCASDAADYPYYYSCPTSSGCTATTPSSTLAVQYQVANPVASFPLDNNGVIVQLPAISASGATSASGYLVFGIGTEIASATAADNYLNGATVLPAPDGIFNTTFSDQQLGYSFIDSGSNGLYFPQPTPNLALCGKTAPADEFYCPGSTTSLSATNQGENRSGDPSGPTSDVSFQVANLGDISGSNFAIDDVAGPALPISGFGTSGTSYFDWGLPFFYGRTIFVAIDDMAADGTTGPYWAY